MFCVYFCVLVCVCKFMSWLTFPDERASIRVWGVRTCLVCPCWVCQLNVVKRFLNDRVSKSTMFHTTVWYCGHQQCATCVRIPKLANSKIYYYWRLYTTQIVLVQCTTQPAISISPQYCVNQCDTVKPNVTQQGQLSLTHGWFSRLYLGGVAIGPDVVSSEIWSIFSWFAETLVLNGKCHMLGRIQWDTHYFNRWFVKLNMRYNPIAGKRSDIGELVS